MRNRYDVIKVSPRGEQLTQVSSSLTPDQIASLFRLKEKLTTGIRHYRFLYPWNEEGQPNYGLTRGDYGNLITGFHVRNGIPYVFDSEIGDMELGGWVWEEPYEEVESSSSTIAVKPSESPNTDVWTIR